MSAAAEAYYQEVLGDIGPLPPILSGQSFALLKPDLRISLQRPNPDNEETVTNNYRRIIHEVGELVQRRVVNDVTGRPENAVLSNNARHVNSAVERLKPTSLQAGHLRNYSIEAVSPDEIEPRLISRAVSSRRDQEIWGCRDRLVALVLSAELYAGRRLGRTAMLSLVAGDAAGGAYRIAGLIYNKNDLLEQSGLWQSAATVAYIGHWGVQNAITQPVRRGRTDKGSGGAY